MTAEHDGRNVPAPKEHEAMQQDGVCPRCGELGLHRDSVDVGVGVIHGPWGCPCGWSEDEEYDVEFAGGLQDDGSYLDPQGGLWPSRSPIARAIARDAAEGRA